VDDAGAPDDPARRKDEDRLMANSEMPLPQNGSLDKYDEDHSGGLNEAEKRKAAGDLMNVQGGPGAQPAAPPAKET
jgi:hypothetical protein